MQSDRELLEAAALAAGLYNVDTRGDDDLWETNATDEDGFAATPSWGILTIGGVWNPLTDDGDAFRLAIRLGLPVWRDDDLIWVAHQSEPATDDPCAAIRRAIVRAAATLAPHP